MAFPGRNDDKKVIGFYLAAEDEEFIPVIEFMIFEQQGNRLFAVGMLQLFNGCGLGIKNQRDISSFCNARQLFIPVQKSWLQFRIGWCYRYDPFQCIERLLRFVNEYGFLCAFQNAVGGGTEKIPDVGFMVQANDNIGDLLFADSINDCIADVEIKPC